MIFEVLRAVSIKHGIL